MALVGIWIALDKSLRTALLALPFSGGACTFTFIAFPSVPQITSLDDEGTTFSVIFTDGLRSGCWKLSLE